ncbi:MAG: restriction endonuclease [Ruminiclostridium sp.]|nr:restriction endonuclease [Ruminiclostridium sp.]
MAMTLYWFIIIIYNVSEKIKINVLLEKIKAKEDLEYIKFMDFLKMIAEVFKRKGYKVGITNKCGEEGNGLILNSMQYVEIWNRGFSHAVDCEAAMKLAKCMRSNSIYRGMLITLGDFKHNTKTFCHMNVIECINGEQLLSMIKDVQKKKEVLQTTS